jgi:DNA polymerase III subunit delta'
VLETIQSRCQVIRLGLTPRTEIALRLRELFGLRPDDAEVVAALSQGRVGRALRAANQPAWQQRRKEMMDLLERALSADALTAFQCVEPLRELASRVPVLIDTLTGVGSQQVAERVAGRIQTQTLLEELAVLVRDLCILHEGGDPDLIVNLDRQVSLTAVARKRTAAALSGALHAVLVAQDLLRRNVSPRLLLEDLLLQLAPG